jgi:hypothetical protein
METVSRGRRGNSCMCEEGWAYESYQRACCMAPGCFCEARKEVDLLVGTERVEEAILGKDGIGERLVREVTKGG